MAKRGQNEGSIYKRRDGRWTAAVSLGYKDGKRWRKTFYGKTRREVQEKLSKALRAQQQGLPVAPERQTVGQFLERWLSDSVKPSVRPLTYDRYEQLVRLHISPALGRIDPLYRAGPAPPDVLPRFNDEAGESWRRTGEPRREADQERGYDDFDGEFHAATVPEFEAPSNRIVGS